VREITDRQLDAFRHFLSKLPHGGDIELVLLKGHILIEEQVRILVDRRLPNPAALRESNASPECHQAIQLAKAFFPPGFYPELWNAISKLNKMRNDIAHNILARESLTDRVEAWIQSFPTGFAGIEDKTLRFEITLWSLFDAVSELVDSPSAVVIPLVPPSNP
jgi:hypothetical protein